MILLVDNYDSFSHNLARYLMRLGQEVRVVRNDAIDADGVARTRPQAVVMSPGPCSPAEAGCCMDVVRRLHESIPMLGVCLGHQAIAAALGGRVVRSNEPVHGRASDVFHDGHGLFAGLPSPLSACRYHSLSVDEATLPDCLEIHARTADGTIMAIAHKTAPLFGLQFHPESILTDRGYELLAAFLRVAGLPCDEAPPIASEMVERQPDARLLPTAPVTF